MTHSDLLMVSSSSESQKLVVSSSLLITVVALSYPARCLSIRDCPFIRGPETETQQQNQHGLLSQRTEIVEFTVIISSNKQQRRLDRPCCSMLSLGRGLSLLKDTTDSVSVWSSKDSRLPVVLGLNTHTHTHTSCTVLHSRHICTSLQAEWNLIF